MASSSRPIAGTSGQRSESAGRSPFSTSFRSGSPLAQESIARDIAASSGEDDTASTDSSRDGENSEYESEASTLRPHHQMSESYRRPSFVAFGGNRPAIAPQHPEISHLSKKEKAKARREEESLLRDNHLAPPKHPRPKDEPLPSRIYRRLFSTKVPKAEGDEEAPDAFVPSFTAQPSETSPLLPNIAPESVREMHERTNRLWEDAVREGKIKTTWQREAKTLVQYSAPLIVTFLLQYSLTVASIFTVGHIGKIELGAGKIIAIQLLNLLTRSSFIGVHDCKHYWFCNIPGACDQFGHALCPGIRLRTQTSRRPPMSTDGTILMVALHSNRRHMVLFKPTS